MVAQNPHAEAILAALEAAGLTVDDAWAPETSPPYVVLYMLPGGEVDGTAASPDSDADLRFQLTTVASHPSQARDIADEAAAALDGLTLTVPGRSVDRIRP